MNWKMAAAVSAALPVLCAGGFGGTRAAWADTTGNAGGLVGADTILFVMGFPAGLQQLNNTGQTITFVDFSTTGYGYVRNEYMGVVQGWSGSYSVSYPTGAPAISHQIAGMLSFGNQLGSLRYTTDDKQPLNGFNFSDPSSYGTGGPTFGYGVWPLAGRWTSGTVAYNTPYGYDYSAYTRALVDTTVENIVGGNAANNLQAPIYVNGVLTSRFRLLTGVGNTGGGLGTGSAGDVTMTQELSLYRSTCRLHWRIVNSDSVPHSVTLRFVVNVRGSISQTGSSTSGQDYFNSGFYFQDPNRGVSNEVTLLSQVPDQLNIYGLRYEQDLSAVNGVVNPPFAARHTYRKYGATPPSQVYVTNPAELDPAVGGTFAPGILNPGQNFLPILDNGVATASYFGPYTLAPGQTQDVITFYGNGTPTELLDDDFVTATEARESVPYNSAAALQAGVAGNQNATNGTVGVQFLNADPLVVYGGIYNRIPATPLANVNLTNVSAALVLPQGLSLTTNPQTGALDTAQKTLGTNGQVFGDKDAITSWNIAPTGDAFGALPYQMTVSTSEFGSRTASRVINVPATPLHQVTASSFQMIGFPFNFDPVVSNNGDPSTVINGLTSPADEPVAFYRWVPDTNSTSGASGTYQLANRLETGIAYFYRANLNRTIFAKGVQPVPGQAGTGSDLLFNFLSPGTTSAGIGQVQVNLERGWNMISNPYLYEIPLNYLRFVPTDSNTTATSQTFAAAVNNGLVRGGIFYFNPTTKSYDFFDQITSPLRPWQGYWLFNNSRVTLVYTLPTQRNSVILPTPDPNNPIEPPTRDYKKPMVPLARVDGALESGRAFGSKQPVVDNWKLQLVASKQNGTSDRATIIGVSPTGRDISTAAQNLPKPPPPVSDYVYMGIVREEKGTRYAQDIKGPNGTKTWTVEVQSDTEGPVTVQWPTIARLPRKLALTVKDESTGRSVGLRSASSLTLDMKKGQTTRLVFTAKTLASQSLSLSPLRTVGGGRASNGGGFGIAFDLNQDAQVSGVIKTLDGRVIAPLASGKAFSVGQGVLHWTGRAVNGSALPMGSYKAEVTAKDETSTVTRTIIIQTLR